MPSMRYRNLSVMSQLNALIFFLLFCSVIARDIGTGDPERMSPQNIEKYIRNEFSGDTRISINVISDINVIEKDYPLFAAVNRAASGKY